MHRELQSKHLAGGSAFEIICRFKLSVSSWAVTNIQGVPWIRIRLKTSGSNKVLSGSGAKAVAPGRVQSFFPRGSPDATGAGPQSSLPAWRSRGEGREPGCVAGPAPSDGPAAPRGEVETPGAPNARRTDPGSASGWAKVCGPAGAGGGVGSL